MKHTNKKGFTIVELVVVIAVIAILAAVLIPNLSNLVTKANKSAAMQEAKAAMDNDLITADGDYTKIPTTKTDGYQGIYTAASGTEESAPHAKYTVKITKSGTEYTCVYDFTAATWTVTAPSDTTN